MPTIDDEIHQQEIETEQLESIAAELAAAVSELQAIEEEATRLLESV